MSSAPEPLTLSHAQLKRVHLRRDRPAAQLRTIALTDPITLDPELSPLEACWTHGPESVMDHWLAQGIDVALDGLCRRLAVTVGWQHDSVDLPLARRLREHIATCDDATYSAMVAQIGQWRTNRVQSVVAAYLVPSEPEFFIDLEAAEEIDERRWLLMAISDVAQLRTITELRPNRRLDAFDDDTPATLADALGVTLLPSLYEWVGAYLGSASVAKQLLGITFDQQTADAFRAIANPIANRGGISAARRDFFARGLKKNPRLAARELLPALANGGTFADKHRQMARHFVADHADVVDAAMATYSDAAQAYVRELRSVAEAETTLPRAELHSLPSLLADPPWENRTRQATRLVVDDVEPLVVEPAMRWEPGERERWLGKPRAQPALGDPSDWENLTSVEQAQLLRFGDVDTMRPFARTFEQLNYYHRDYAARFELDVSAAVREFVYRRKQAWETPAWAIVIPFGLPDLVDPVVDVYGKATGASRFAQEWMVRHRDLAALHLVPRVVSSRRKGRSVADAALRLIARYDEPVVRQAAARYGDEVIAAIDQFLAVDPLDVLPTRTPSLPDYVRPAQLVPPVLRSSNEALPPDAVGNVVIMIGLSKETEYAGVDRVRELCTPESLAAFSLSVYRAWANAGRIRKDRWLTSGVDMFGNDSIVDDVAGVISNDVSVSDELRRDQIDLMARIGSDRALSALFHISNLRGRKATMRLARETVNEMADMRGLSSDELADRLIRTFDLDNTGSMLLDFGPRSFRVTFDELLTPVIRSDDGDIRKALPKANKHDDAELASLAHDHFKLLKKGVKATAKEQLKRFERAMVLGRRWPRAEWERHFVSHPLMRHVVRRLVWGVYESAETDAALVATFRIAEDGSLADQVDGAFELESESVVGVVHPIELANPAMWTTVFEDYEIAQPFEQLSRQTFTAHSLPDGIDGDDTTFGITGAPFVPYQRILGLTSRGWDNEQIGSSTGNFSRMFRCGQLSLMIDPGFAWGQDYADQRVLPISLQASDPIDISEVVRDLVWLGRPA